MGAEPSQATNAIPIVSHLAWARQAPFTVVAVSWLRKLETAERMLAVSISSHSGRGVRSNGL